MPPRKRKAPPPEPEPEETTTEPEDTGDENEIVDIPFGDNPSETATLLLAAAEETGLGSRAVRTSSDGFHVPKIIADKAKK